MLQRIEMDEHVPLADQLAEEVGPVTLINTFKVAPEDSDALLNAWAADAAYLKTKPGFISTQLYRGIAGSGVFVEPGGLGVGGGLPQRLRGSAVPGDLRPLSGLDGGLTASVPEGGRARHLRGPLARRRQQLQPGHDHLEVVHLAGTRTKARQPRTREEEPDWLPTATP